MRIFLGLAFLMLAFFTVHAWGAHIGGVQAAGVLAQHKIVAPGADAVIFMAQSEGEGNNQRRCGRRDGPPLSS